MKLPASSKNWISILGALLAVFNLASILSLMILNSVFGFGGSYIGLFIYIVLPGFMVIGLLLIPIGMRIYRKRARQAEQEGGQLNWPIIDFNNLAVRNASIIFVVGTVFLLIISSIGSYEAFHYTESTEFCGKLCHEVMEPEYTTYHGSSHERVACVECHVGSGASWYVKSKLSGLYQVYSVMANKYPSPIPTPIANLRPARETCEECHWPEKFYDSKLRVQHTYLADDMNTENVYHLQIKTSSKATNHGFEVGIHQHINPKVKVEYKALDDKRQVIPWVKYTNTETGESTVFTDQDYPMAENELDSLPLRVMDCLDCHNRPSHDFKVPQNYIDEAITSGAISKDIPSIKMIALMAVNQEYATKDSAFMAIEAQVKEYYEAAEPEFFEQQNDKLKQAIEAIQLAYSQNVFPAMKANWQAYPNNIGHMESDGCFRCHNDRHASADGKVLSKDCNLCHEILAQGAPESLVYSESMESLDFAHPADVGEDWRTENCSTCHSALY